MNFVNLPENAEFVKYIKIQSSTKSGAKTEDGAEYQIGDSTYFISSNGQKVICLKTISKSADKLFYYQETSTKFRGSKKYKIGEPYYYYENKNSKNLTLWDDANANRMFSDVLIALDSLQSLLPIKFLSAICGDQVYDNM